MGFTGERPGGPSRRAHDSGFTLVEVIVAGVIMVMVLVPSAMLLSSSAKVLTITQAKIVAANLASGVLDEDRAVADATAPPAYGILVRVSWLGGSHSMTAGATLSTPVIVVAAGTGNSGGAPSSSATCPL